MVKELNDCLILCYHMWHVTVNFLVLHTIHKVCRVAINWAPITTALAHPTPSTHRGARPISSFGWLHSTLMAFLTPRCPPRSRRLLAGPSSLLRHGSSWHPQQASQAYRVGPMSPAGELGLLETLTPLTGNTPRRTARQEHSQNTFSDFSIWSFHSSCLQSFNSSFYVILLRNMVRIPQSSLASFRMLCLVLSSKSLIYAVSSWYQ